MADLPPDNRTGAPNSATFDASSINPATSWSTHCRATTTLAAGSTHKLMKRPSPIDTGEPAALSCIRAGVTAEESTELRELKKRNRLLEHESRVLRRPAAYLSQRTCRENDLPISQLRASHEPPANLSPPPLSSSPPPRCATLSSSAKAGASKEVAGLLDLTTPSPSACVPCRKDRRRLPRRAATATRPEPAARRLLLHRRCRVLDRCDHVEDRLTDHGRVLSSPRRSSCVAPSMTRWALLVDMEVSRTWRSGRRRFPCRR
jgi:hypothetical protein